MKTKKSSFFMAAIIITVFVLVAIFGLGKNFKGARDMRFGIDIRGGVEAIFEPDDTTVKPTQSDLEAARNIINSRLDAKNILDREVTIDTNAGNIIVRFPWKSDEKDFNPETAIQELGETARLTFRDPEGNVLVEGKDVQESTVQQDQKTGAYMVIVRFNSKGTKDFANATKQLIGKSMGIYMDDYEIKAPIVQGQITGGEAFIEGHFNFDEASNLSEKINAGSLPFSLKTTNYNTISPSLGNNALKAMVMAGMLAFIIICLFMMIYYKLPGMVSCLTLIFQMSLQMLLLSVPQFTITLPGIAGLILSVGMAVDSNIIISARIGEELYKGITVKKSVKNGYHNAFSSVIDGNITTAIVAVILMIFGSGTMLSFGYTLLTGVLVNILVGVFFSRKMLQSLIQFDRFNELKYFRIKKEHKVIGFSKKRKLLFGMTGLILVLGAAGSLINGVKLDTQFTGGVILKYSYEGSINQDEIDTKIQQLLNRPTSIQVSEDGVSGEKKLIITLAGHEGIAPNDQKKVGETLNQLGDAKFKLSENYVVEPYIGKKALNNSVVAIVLSALFIVIYVWIRFKSLSGLSAGVTSVIALIHDVLMVFFVFGIFKIPLNDAFVAVTLTIIGYSINDTIVLYDRIRENLTQVVNKSKVGEVVDLSITETLGRSINTSLTTMICVLTVLIFSLIFGIESIRVFSLPLLVGIISGCYSSIFIAGPLWAVWKEFKWKRGHKYAKN